MYSNNKLHISIEWIQSLNWKEWNPFFENEWNQLFQMIEMCVLKWLKQVFWNEWNKQVKSFFKKWVNSLLLEMSEICCKNFKLVRNVFK